MVSEVQAAAKDSQPPEAFIAELGELSSNYLKPSVNYRGSLYRIKPEQRKTVCEILGFSARFDFPAILSAQLDLFESQAQATFEIKRNTKPADINVRYARDRWSVHELTGKNGEGLRPSIRSEYHCKAVSDANKKEIAAALGIDAGLLPDLLLRLNLKGNKLLLIAAEQFSNKFPDGAETTFDLSPVIEQTTEDVLRSESGELQETTSRQQQYEHQQSSIKNIKEGSSRAMDNLSPENKDKEIIGTTTSTTDIKNREPVTVAQTEEDKNVEAVQTETASAAKSRSESEDSSPKENSERKQPDSFFTRHEPSSKSTSAPERQERAALSTSGSPERQRLASTSASTNTPTRAVSAETQPKYAVYSKSEIDYMFKQQADQILAALSSKVAAQQRGFQDAITAQEKAFNRIAENFSSNFDEARIRLENTSRGAQELTHKELEDFHKQFSKELEQYRTQINKVVLPVSKALEDPSKFKPQQTRENAKSEQQSSKGGNTNLATVQKQLRIAMGAAIVSAIIALVSCILTGITIGEIKTLLTTSARASHTEPPANP